jgi:3-isopropylmalate dehydratase small subunit
MEPFVTLRSTAVVLPLENVDTDQIIPARFLKTTDRLGLGNHLFADWRYDASGAPRPEFVLNRAEARTAQCSWRGRTSDADLRASTRHGRCSATDFARW